MSGNLHEVPMDSTSDAKLCVANYQDEFHSQFETPQWGSVGSEAWGYNFLSELFESSHPFGIGFHDSDMHHTQHQSFEPYQSWNDCSGHGQGGGYGEWTDAVLPEDRWSYVDVDHVGMYGSDGREGSLVNDTAMSQSTDSAYGGPEPQLQESVLAASTSPFQHVDYTYGSTTSRENSSRQPGNLTASVRAGIPQYPSFKAAREAILPRYWRCPVEDPTLPKTDADRQRYIRQLLTALNNVEDTIGVQGHSFKKRWYDPSKGYSHYYTPLVKEALCWLILSQAESLHTNGPSQTFVSFDPNFWTTAKKTCRWKFSERIDAITRLLATSKSKCDAFLGGGSLQLVVANPGQRLRATKADVRQNEKRKELLEAVKGKERLGKKVKIEPAE